MARPRWKRLTIATVKTVVGMVVLWAVGRHVIHTWNDLENRRIALRFDPIWLLVSGVLYLAGLSAYGRFFERILHASPTPVGIGPALRAYLVSHLGKYVPGKAMVVVLRTAMVVPFGVRASTAAIATFYETLVMMASGAMIAGAGFAMANGTERVDLNLPFLGLRSLPVYGVAALSGFGMGLGFLTLVIPPIFRRLVGMASSPIPGVGPDALPRLSAPLLVQGLSWSACGWLLLGLSQLAVVRASDPSGAKAILSLGLVPVVVASVALATVAGFIVAVLPGGLGVREGVLMSALAPALGSDRAVVAALVLRLVWVVSELAAALVLVLLLPGRGIPMKTSMEAGPSPL